jgi:hypothetical protein
MTLTARKSTCLIGTSAILLASAVILAQALPGQLGLGLTDAQNYFLDAIAQGGVSYGSAGKAFVALSTAARVTVVREGLAWARAYSDSAAFKTAYDKRRDQQKPEAPTFEGTVDQVLQKKQNEQKKQLADSRAMLAQLPADQRAQLETVFKQTETQMNDPAYLAMMRQGIEMDRATAQKEYQSALADWQKNYPADSHVLVARRLQLFLTVSADVDFSAKIEGTGTGKRFVNPDYQQKPGDWKMCYRAGREPVDAARAAVSDWLKTMPKS